MASASSIARLHRNPPQLRHNCQQPAPVKSDTVADSEPSLLEMQQRYWASMPVRRRFGSPRPDAPALMSTMSAPTAVDRNGAFASMAARDRAAVAMRAAVGQWQAQQARRGGAGHPQHGPLAIQL